MQIDPELQQQSNRKTLYETNMKLHPLFVLAFLLTLLVLGNEYEIISSQRKNKVRQKYQNLIRQDPYKRHLTHEKFQKSNIIMEGS